MIRTKQFGILWVDFMEFFESSFLSMGVPISVKRFDLVAQQETSADAAAAFTR